jgi:hypothetical protein
MFKLLEYDSSPTKKMKSKSLLADANVEATDISAGKDHFNVRAGAQSVISNLDSLLADMKSLKIK